MVDGARASDPAAGTPAPARSYLFVPADRPERYAKALASGADAVIVDLEDAVAAEAKAAAREALAAYLDAAAGTPAAAGAAGAPSSSVVPTPLLVRINDAASPWFAADLALLARPGIAGVVVAKAERAADLARVHAAAGGRPVLPLVETAAGIEALRELAGAAGVERLVFGSLDLQLDLGIESDEDELLLFRSRLVLVSRLAGLRAPVDGVCTALDDEAVLTCETLRARRLGFSAKLCIHPRQVAAVNAALAPSPVELAWAERVVAAVQRSAGAAVAVDGKMVDTPVLRRAEALLARRR